MSATINTYASAIVAGQIQEIADILSPSIKIMPPGSNQPNEGKGKTSMMLSAVAAIVTDYKAVRIYTAGDDWYTVLLEGLLDNSPVQLIDQVHIDVNDQVDHVDIFLRPASLAESLLGKVTAEIQRRKSL